MNAPRWLSGNNAVGGSRVEEPVDAEALIDEAWDLWEENDTGGAFAKLEQVPSTERGGVAYLALMSVLCDELNLPKRRLRVMRQLVDADPTIDIHWVGLGHAVRRLQGAGAGVRIWLQALRKDPTFVLVRWNLAQHYMAVGCLRAAREQLKIALFLDPDLIGMAMDEPSFAAVWETIAEADPPPPEEGEEWKDADVFV